MFRSSAGGFDLAHRFRDVLGHVFHASLVAADPQGVEVVAGVVHRAHPDADAHPEAALRRVLDHRLELATVAPAVYYARRVGPYSKAVHRSPNGVPFFLAPFPGGSGSPARPGGSG